MASHGLCVVVCRLTPLLCSIGCVVFQATAGVETRRVHREGVPGTEPAMDHCVVDKRKHKTNNQLERRHSRSLGPLQQKRRDKQAINRFEVCMCILWLEAENHAAIVFTPPPTGERSIVMRVSVCVCVCVFVRDHIFGTTRPIFTIFLCVLPIDVARFSAGGVVICYVLPVLWMTSYWLRSQDFSTSPPN